MEAEMARFLVEVADILYELRHRPGTVQAYADPFDAQAEVLGFLAILDFAVPGAVGNSCIAVCEVDFEARNCDGDTEGRPDPGQEKIRLELSRAILGQLGALGLDLLDLVTAQLAEKEGPVEHCSSWSFGAEVVMKVGENSTPVKLIAKLRGLSMAKVTRGSEGGAVCATT